MTKKVFETGNIAEPTKVATEASADVMFVAGAMRAAKFASPEIRAKILADVQAFTQTPSERLDFMFATDNDNNDHAIFDMPDSERRRQIIKNNFLDAAE